MTSGGIVKRALAGVLGAALAVMLICWPGAVSPMKQYILVLAFAGGFAVGSKTWWPLIYGVIYSGGSLTLHGLRWGWASLGMNGSERPFELSLMIGLGVAAGICMGYLIRPLLQRQSRV